MNFKLTLLFVVGLSAAVLAAPGGARGKRSPQLPPMPQPPPGIPMPPGMLEMADVITRFARQADDVPQEPPKRIARQADDVPQEPPKRVARQATISEMEKPQHLRQEAFYSSITSMSRKKRGSA